MRVLSAEGVRLFLAEVEARARSHGQTGNEHFRADGARVESWASLESFVRQHGHKAHKLQAAKEEDPGHPTLNFGGQTRSHATHRRRADPDSGWDRKAQGQEARLGLGGPVLRDNRRGLGVEFRILDPMAEPEPEVALQPAARVEALPSGVRGRTAGATRPSPVSVCGGLPAVGVAPQVACKHRLRVAGWDRRTTARSGYRFRQKLRKRVGEILGWIQTVGGWRWGRDRGRPRAEAWGDFAVAAYNVLRMARLSLAAAGLNARGERASAAAG